MNEIKELRAKSNLSQSKFAAKYDIPVRTLQQWEQGISTPPPYVIGMLKRVDAMVAEPAFDIEKYRHSPRTSWKVCIRNAFKNCAKIYPIQQKKVRELIDDIKNDQTVKRIIIFGSSTTEMCHIGSDVDIYVEMSDDHNPIRAVHHFEYDFWNSFRVDERLKSEILAKGVVVYERS